MVDAQGVTITYDNGAANIEVRTPDNFEVTAITGFTIYLLIDFKNMYDKLYCQKMSFLQLKTSPV